MENKKLNTFALVGFVLGLCSFLISLWGIIPIVGIVFSGLALAQIDLSVEKGKGFAVVGLISSIINLVFTFIVLLPLL